MVYLLPCRLEAELHEFWGDYSNQITDFAETADLVFIREKFFNILFDAILRWVPFTPSGRV